MPQNRIRYSNDFVLRNGQVGIGTSTPRAKLDVIGDALVSGNLGVGGSIINPKISGVTTYIGVATAYNYPTGPLSVGLPTNITEIKPYNRTDSTLSFLGYGNQMLTLDDNFTTDAFLVYNYNSKPYASPTLNRETGQFVDWTPLVANYEQAFRIDRSGNVIVGIGTTITAKLDIRGSVNLGPLPGSPGAIGTSNVHNINGNTTLYGDLNLYTYKIRPRTGPHISTSNYVEISPNIADSGSLNFYTGTASTTLLPQQILSLTNNVVGSLFRVNDPVVGFGSTTNLSIGQTFTALFEVNSNGNVGVGTSIPTSKFQVVGNALITGITTVGLGTTSSPAINSSMSFELTNNTTLTVRVRDSGGTIRTGTIALT